GYKMRAVGVNPSFARYIGIPVGSTIILSQVIGGAFAGMGGSVQILGMFPRYKWESLTGYGFDGLMIAVLARKNPVLVPLSAFLIAYIRTGASLVATKTQIPPEFVSIIQGIIIVLVAAEMFLSGWKKRLIFSAAKKSLKEKEAKA
ncbi:MAG TPA: ABC transporter permease, partial [Lachnospiraceae bacterium]|nr:ABC transporter permease [Lachnospiraceae bacterium]